MTEPVSFDPDMAAQFLAALESTGQRVWQARALPEGPGASGKPKVYQGAAADVIASLAGAGDGYGSFVMVNPSTGPKAADVTGVAAVWLDFDTKDYSSPEACTAAMRLAHEGRDSAEGTAPDGWPFGSMVVKTGGGWHVYWLLEDCPLDRFTAVQKALAKRFGGDPAVSDLPRIMRLPGSLHWKTGKPLPVGLKICKPERRYQLDDLLTRLGVELDAPPAEDDIRDQAEFTVASSRPDTPDNRTDIAAALGRIDPDCSRAEWLKALCAIKALGWADSEQIAHAWSVKGAKHSEPEFSKAWQSLKSEGGVTPSSLYFLAGPDPEGCEPAGTEQGMACRFVTWLGGSYTHLHDVWHRWNGAYWKPCSGREIESAMVQYAREYALDAQRRRLASPDDPGAKAEHAAANRLLARHSQDSVIDLARRMLYVCPVEEDEMLLTTPTSTVDLRTGKISAPDPARYATRCTNVAPDFGREPRELLRLLNWIFNDDAEMLGYMQRWFGYCLTGSPAEEVMQFWHGHSGANGKSTLVNALAYIFGSYAATVDTGLLMSEPRDGRPRPELLALRGVRLALANETKVGERFNDAAVKKLVSTETIAARTLYSGEIHQIRPSWKIILRGNNRPSVLDGDAFWRRVAAIPFAKSVPEPQRDHGLEARLKAEGPAILAWCIRGSQAWQEQQLGRPALVAEATAAYRGDEDQTGAWIAARVEAGGLTSRAAIRDCYARWTGRDPLRIPKSEMSALYDQLRDRFGETKHTGTRGYRCALHEDTTFE